VTTPNSETAAPFSPPILKCGVCGQANDPRARFCADCGNPLGAGAEMLRPGFTPAEGVSATNGPQDTSAWPKCRKCGQHIDPQLPYCGHCGTKVVLKTEEGTCPSCGATYTKGADLYCNKCGTRVGQRVSIIGKPTVPGPSGVAIVNAASRTTGPQLAILDEQGEPSMVFTLDRGEAVIGRGEADIKFEFDVYLTPLHARVDLRDGQLWLRDLGSRNGSWVFIDEPTKLVDSDMILIGSQILRFRRLGYPGPHPPEADSTRRMGSVTPPVDVAVLEQMRVDGSIRDVFHLSPGRSATLGRETGDWIFPYDQTMSGRHAEIVSEDIEFFVHDAESRNGVAMAVRGDRVLKKGQRFLLGDQILRVENV
jgi:pSer/pThr/pTyr-binding forkhead associated (FHA) protein